VRSFVNNGIATLPWPVRINHARTLLFLHTLHNFDFFSNLRAGARNLTHGVATNCCFAATQP
jgi:hypothetical protein